MTSNKIVFSLASFVVLLALAFVAPCMVGKREGSSRSRIARGEKG